MENRGSLEKIQEFVVLILLGEKNLIIYVKNPIVRLYFLRYTVKHRISMQIYELRDCANDRKEFHLQLQLKLIIVSKDNKWFC